MAASKHLGIRDAVAALYMAGTPLAGGYIEENRDKPLPDGRVAQIHVYRVISRPERTNVSAHAPIDWWTDIRTVVKARKTGLSTAEAVADDIACECFARVMADQTLGGLVGQIEPGDLGWDQDELDSSVVLVTWNIRVWHRTEFNTIA